MVARRVPLTRRLKAWSGAIFSGLVWLIAATISGGLYLLDVGKGDTLVVARIQSVPIRVPESGRISSVSVKTGDHVEAGQILAVLEIPGLQQEIGAATATLEAARGGLSNQTNDRSRRYQTDVADARANYLSANVALKEQQARLAELELEYRRVTAPGVALPVAEVEGVTARREAARALVDAQQKELDGLKSSLDQAISRAGGMMDPQVQAQLDALSLQLEMLKARQEAVTLRAPSAGVVTGDLVPPGTWMPAGLQLMAVNASGTREAVAWLPAASVSSIKIGTTVSLEGPEGVMAATIQSIGPGVEPVPGQALSDPARPEWKVPVLLQVERDLLPGEVLIASF